MTRIMAPTVSLQLKKKPTSIIDVKNTSRYSFPQRTYNFYKPTRLVHVMSFPVPPYVDSVVLANGIYVIPFFI